MGLSLSVAAVIIGVSIVTSIGILSEGFLPTITSVNDSFKEMKDRSIEQVQTDINISSISTFINGANYNLNFSVKNIGSVVLDPEYFDVLINGTSRTFSYTSSILYPEEVVYFNVTNIPNTGNAKLKVITDNGISDYYEYIIT